VSLSLESILRRQPGADASSLNGEVVVLDAEGRMVRALNGTAARVWQLLDGQRTVRQICETIASEFDAGAEAIEADVLTFLNYLCRVQLAVGGVK
jgi:pyrroloquinoline quinone biosynthesis protein D